jgi:hypothetical protein
MTTHETDLFGYVLGKGCQDLTGFDQESLAGTGVAASLKDLCHALTCRPPLATGTTSPGTDPLTALFISRCASSARAELAGLEASDPGFGQLAVSLVYPGQSTPEASPDQSPGHNLEERRERLWQLFFPEGSGLLGDQAGTVASIRSRRMIKLDSLNPDPIQDPASQILFTGNVLLTVPADPGQVASLDLSDTLKDRIALACREPQRYFYDHPIRIGEATASNEAIYGLRGLDDMMAYEKAHGRAAPADKATVILSLSVTHDGLRDLAPDYLKEELAKAGPLEHLAVYLFSELDCQRIIHEVLVPLLGSGKESPEAVALLEVFGVDGEYGRHYSFLKAIAAYWQVFVDPRIKGTFKIDLDQVFPQEDLEAGSGLSVFGHLGSALWGARGRDAEGTPVELGMIAGALVNEKDIHSGIFTPDVTLPASIPPGESAVFYNRVPMALSTEAEMMLRYGKEGNPDGKSTCSQRFHVTGGTNGILVKQLRKHRPFTPSFMGRAEDQAYLMSVLYQATGIPEGNTSIEPACLRYAHQPGLIMRHDKEAFAGPAIEAARHGRFVGDLARTYLFSRYAQALPWGFERTKSQLDPFTGCFITRRCWSIIVLRLVFTCARTLQTEGEGPAAALFKLASERLSELLDADEGKVPSVGERYQREKAAWDLYYTALDKAEKRQDPKQAGLAVAQACRIG